MRRANQRPAPLASRSQLYSLFFASLFASTGSFCTYWFASYFIGTILGLHVLVAGLLAVATVPVGAILGFGLFAQMCKFADKWPMQAQNSWFGNWFQDNRSIWQKLSGAPRVFIADCKRAFRAYDRMLLKVCAEQIAIENNPEYRQYVEQPTDSDKTIWGFITNPINRLVQRNMREEAMPFVTQTMMVGAIHVNHFRSINEEYLHRLTYDQREQLVMQEAAKSLSFLYDNSLIGKGLLETVATTICHEYHNPPARLR